MGVFQKLSELLDEIPKLEDAYALPGQNSAADRLYLMLQFKTTELSLCVGAYRQNRREEEDRRKEEDFEKEMFRLGFALGFMNFGDRS